MKNFLIKIIFVILLVLQSPFHAIALPKCSGDYDTVRWTDCFGVYEWSTGFQYSGEFKDGKRHGFGVSEFPNGTKYSGKYKFGSEDGDHVVHRHGWYGSEEFAPSAIDTRLST